MYFYKFDFEKDDQDEIVYKAKLPYPRGPENYDCNISSSYSVFDRKITFENVAEYSVYDYSNLSLSVSDQLFIFGNKVINSNWMPIRNHYRIELWTSNSHAAICKVNVE